MHQLTRERLQVIENIPTFFDAYFGAEVLKNLEEPLIRFSQWPKTTLESLRELCIFFASAIPEGDHVVRADVATRHHAPRAINAELLLYIGYQLGSPRRQHIGIGHRPCEGGIELVTYIAGAVDGPNLAATIQEEDVDQLINNQTIRNKSDAQEFAKRAKPAVDRQRQLIIRSKPETTTSGFCPAFCQRRWNSEHRRPEEEAKKVFLKFFEARRKSVAPPEFARENTLLRENNYYRHRRAVAYIQDLVPVEDAYVLALSDHA